MNILDYNNQKVFMEEGYGVHDITTGHSEPSTIKDAYFFKFDKGKYVKTPFDINMVKEDEIGLMLDIKGKGWGEVSFIVPSLEGITNFLCDTNALGDLNVLKNKDLTAFYRFNGPRIIGVGLENNK